jgi:hypothetical protein
MALDPANFAERLVSGTAARRRVDGISHDNWLGQGDPPLIAARVPPHTATIIDGHLNLKHRLPRAPAIALLQDAMSRPGFALVHFDDTSYGGIAEPRSSTASIR